MDTTISKKYKILWIDDDVNNPELLSDKDALEDQGCIIKPITNPDELDGVNVSAYDCIIIDLSMPTGTMLEGNSETRYGSRTGYVLLKQLKEKYPKLKTIVYSVFKAPLEINDYCLQKHIQYWNKSACTSDAFAEKIVNLIKEDE